MPLAADWHKGHIRDEDIARGNFGEDSIDNRRRTGDILRILIQTDYILDAGIPTTIEILCRILKGRPNESALTELGRRSARNRKC